MQTKKTGIYNHCDITEKVENNLSWLGEFIIATSLRTLAKILFKYNAKHFNHNLWSSSVAKVQQTGI